MDDATAYTVQKLAHQYCITRLAAAGDEALGEDLREETTPLGRLADMILGDCGYGRQPRVAEAFAERFLGNLSSRATDVVTIRTATIRDWAAAESVRSGAVRPRRTPKEFNTETRRHADILPTGRLRGSVSPL